MKPARGWLCAEGGTRREFGGWLELIGLLEAALAHEQPTTAAAPPRPSRTMGP